jgi:hypothetical protein
VLEILVTAPTASVPLDGLSPSALGVLPAETIPQARQSTTPSSQATRLAVALVNISQWPPLHTSIFPGVSGTSFIGNLAG